MPFKVATPFTEDMDAALREAYLCYTPGIVRRLCAQFSCDYGVLRRRATKLGLPKIKQNRYAVGYSRWTGPEIRLLLEYEHLNSRQLEAIFHKHGYLRSDGAIDCFRRLHHSWLASQHQDEFNHGYSTFQLEELLGIDASTITRWIHKGLLEAHQSTGPNWRVRREHLLQFLIEHPARWNCRNVDTYWLMDLIQEHLSFKTKPVRNHTHAV